MPDGALIAAPALLPFAGLPGGPPAWAARFLAAEPDPLGGGPWYATTLAHALPPGTEPLAAVTGAVLLPLLRRDGRLTSLTTDYSLEWRPLPAPGAVAGGRRGGGGALAALSRRRPPLRLEALDPEARGLADVLEGFRAGGLRVLRYRHFGNWAEAVAPGLGWEGY